MIRLIDLRTWSVVGHLVDPQNNDYDCIQFSPDGSQLAFTCFGWNLGIWNLSEVGAGLEELQLSAAGLPRRKFSRGRTHVDLTVDRGTELPAPEQWIENWMTLARLEEFKGVPADAAANVTKAIEQLRPGAPPAEIAELYTRRGYYSYLSGSPVSARDDWKTALQLQPQKPEATRRLARLCLLGPEELRDPLYALHLLGPFALTETNDPTIATLVGVAHYRLGQFKNALNSFQGISDAPDDPLRTIFLQAARRGLLKSEEHVPIAMDLSSRREGTDRLDSLERKEMEQVRAEFESQLSERSETTNVEGRSSAGENGG